MGTLTNPRHERFAQALFEGETADAAYLKAGFKANRGNASRLKANENISARLAELQAAAAKASEVTVQSLLGELETARVRADNAEQFSASVRAIEAKARVSGLLTQKIEITNVTEEFDNAESIEDIAAVLANALAADKGYALTPEEKAGFTKLLIQWIEVLNQYLAGCEPKPVPQITRVRDQENLERRRLGLPRRVGGNGSQR
jgi:hypothetical protein